MFKKVVVSSLCLPILLLTGCATESSHTVEVAKVATTQTSWHGQRSLITVGKFDNRSDYMNGIFSDGVDRLGNQSKTILVTHLQQTGRFNVLDRTNMDEIKTEAGISGKSQQLKGATYVITGDVTEFGRKETGDRALFGILVGVNRRLRMRKLPSMWSMLKRLKSCLLPGRGRIRTVEPRNSWLRWHSQL
jgi:curli biogenesis system outer membrane secretion channel CsgG